MSSSPPSSGSRRFSPGKSTCSPRNTTFTLTRDVSLGLHDTVVTYYDGQGFIVPKSNIKSAKQFKNQTVRAVGHHHGEKPDRLLQGQ
jgi:general L-amino acid transport system substrate-binding protein